MDSALQDRNFHPRYVSSTYLTFQDIFWNSLQEETYGRWLFTLANSLQGSCSSMCSVSDSCGYQIVLLQHREKKLLLNVVVPRNKVYKEQRLHPVLECILKFAMNASKKVASPTNCTVSFGQGRPAVTCTLLTCICSCQGCCMMCSEACKIQILNFCTSCKSHTAF